MGHDVMTPDDDPVPTHTVVRDMLAEPWSPRRMSQWRRGAEARVEKRRVLVQLGSGLGLAGTVATLLFLFTRSAPAPVARGPLPAAKSPPATLPRMTFQDGSVATLLDPASVIRPREKGGARPIIEFGSGRARFHVVHDAGHPFRVESGGVVIEDQGTDFVLHRVGTQTEVAVEHGQVRVSWIGGWRQLAAGEGGWFPPSAARPAPSVLPARAAMPPPAPRDDWKRLAQRDPPAAYLQLQRAGLASVRDEPQELFLAADVARKSHHAEEAISPLQRLIARHPHDPQAPLAQFTLATILDADLGRPRAAAAAFARVEELAAGHALVEDARAREALAWFHANDRAAAAQAARRYLDRYPEGRHAEALRTLVDGH